MNIGEDWIVICLSDSVGETNTPSMGEPSSESRYTLATHQIFTEVQAEAYMKTIAPSRKPIMVELDPVRFFRRSTFSI